jgi:hypothetical protein
MTVLWSNDIERCGNVYREPAWKMGDLRDRGLMSSESKSVVFGAKDERVQKPTSCGWCVIRWAPLDKSVTAIASLVAFVAVMNLD